MDRTAKVVAQVILLTVGMVRWRIV
jgi:hypothetical protein